MNYTIYSKQNLRKYFIRYIGARNGVQHVTYAPSALEQVDDAIGERLLQRRRELGCICLDFKNSQRKVHLSPAIRSRPTPPIPFATGVRTKIQLFATITTCAAWFTTLLYVSVQYALCVPPCPVSSKSGGARAPPAHGAGVACRCIIILLLLAYVTAKMCREYFFET